MRKNLTEVVFILDRSGSMSGLEKDTIGGFNSLIERQRSEPGEALVSTVLFNDNTQVLHDRVRLDEVQPITEREYRVGGCTALLDAIGGAIHHIGNVHKYARSEDVPEHTLFVITTDGMENASRRYSAQRVKEIAGEINRDYVGQEIMLVSVLRGSFVFMADLCRRIDLPCTVDFMAVSSYGGGTSSSGQVQITKDLSSDITGKNIIVVEDILDSGNTLSYLLKVLEQRSPASIRLCTLLDKPERRVKPVEVHYSGFTIPDAFVVGYGLDYAEHYRNLPYIGILKPEVYGG